MRINQIPGIINDLLDLESWHHPLDNIFPTKKYEINLLTGKQNILEEDSITKLLDSKRKWFVKRIQNLNGKFEDFAKAKIKIFGVKEKVEIIYKDKKFNKEHLFKTIKLK